MFERREVEGKLQINFGLLQVQNACVSDGHSVRVADRPPKGNIRESQSVSHLPLEQAQHQHPQLLLRKSRNHRLVRAVRTLLSSPIKKNSKRSLKRSELVKTISMKDKKAANKFFMKELETVLDEIDDEC